MFITEYQQLITSLIMISRRRPQRSNLITEVLSLLKAALALRERDDPEMSSSPSPSSSAVTIPTPGRSILKRPPPPQQSFFSLGRLSKLLPTQNATALNGANDETKALKRAHFILPELTTVYPIHAANPPSTPSLKEEKRSIEEREAERRKRIVRRNSISPEAANAEEQQWWSLEQVESFYRECCVGREEVPDAGISAAFLVRLDILRVTPYTHCSASLLSIPEVYTRVLWTSLEYNSRLARRLCCRTSSPSSGACGSLFSKSVTLMSLFVLS